MMIVKTPRSRANTLIDFLLTALAWLVFCYLFASGILSILEGSATGPAAPLASRLPPDLHTLLTYAYMAAGIGLLLLAWARYNKLRFGGLNRRKAPPALTCAALASSFEISAELLEAMRASRITCIHHTEKGRISGIDFVRSTKTVPDNILRILR
jgi:biofilm PGA synthesis protein PgaD